MFKNYLKLAYRSLLKQKVASIVNIAGLAISVACAIVAYYFISGQLVPEIFHTNGKKIFQVQSELQTPDDRYYTSYTPVPLGPAIEADHAQVLHAVRIQEAALTIQHDKGTFRDLVRFADPAFLTMFTVPLQHGEEDVLLNPNTVVLSADAAVKYFGDDNPVGQALTIESEAGEPRSYTVGAVAAPFPIESVANFSVLMAYDQFEHVIVPNPNMQEPDFWSRNVRATFVQLHSAKDKEALESLLMAYTDVHSENLDIYARTISYRLDNLNNIALSASFVRGSFSSGIPWAPVIILSTITLFLFLLSCFNYINISLGASNRRIKEIGIRKVIGSRRSQLVTQFLFENVLLCLAALITGIILAGSLLPPCI